MVCAVEVHIPTVHGAFTLVLEVPSGEVALAELVPSMQRLSSALSKFVIAAKGAQVSCGPGCGACCVQLVPVTEPEMHALASVVERMGPERKARVLGRFEAVKERLADAGLLDRLRSPPTEPEGYVRMVMEYIRARIPCPFLEDGSCSIHADRPTICREYSVTSAATRCATPFQTQVDVVRMPANLAYVVQRAVGAHTQTKMKITALPLIFDWIGDHPERLPRVDGPAFLRAVVEHLAEAVAPPA
jgi:Fe-S-cluster containining protein